MEIISIKTSKTPNRVWLNFSDGSFIPFFIDDVVKLSLVKNKEIDESKLQLIFQTCLLFVARDYALRQIAISPKTEKMISQKLKFFLKKTVLKYKINTNNLDNINQQIILELKERKLLNEKDFVDYFIKKNQKKSHQQIIYCLQRLGVNSEFLASITSNRKNDLDKIKVILEKKNLNKSKITDIKVKNKIKASLYRRGFSLSDINRAFDD